MTSLPPCVLAKATTVFIYFSLLSGTTTLYSIFFDSPENSSSSALKVMPLPIFSCSGAQSLKSYFGAAPFHDTRFSSFFHPFALSERTPSCSTISYLISAIFIHPSCFFVVSLKNYFHNNIKYHF